MKQKNIKMISFLVIVVAILIGNHHFGWSAYLGDADHLMFLVDMVKEQRVLAFAIYVGLTIIGCVVLALPGITFALIAGMLFGPWLGILACLLATTLGAMLAFLVGRFFLKDAVKPMLENNKLLKKLLFSDNPQKDIVVLMITRMVPIFPYNLQNFAYGITDIGFTKYSVLTFLFMLPGVSFYTIVALPDEEVLTELSNHLQELSGDGDMIQGLNKWERTAYYVDELCMEVDSGGFEGYLYYHGTHFEKAYKALEQMGAAEMTALLDRVRAKFPRNRIPKAADSIQNTMDRMEEKGVDFEAEDDSYYGGAERELLAKLTAYVRENGKHFR